MIAFSLPALLSGGIKEDPKILILNSYPPGDDWADSEMTGILSMLKKAYPALIPFIGYLATKRYPSVDHRILLKEILG